MPVLPQGFYVGSTSRHILKKGEAEPTSPGILVTYRASTTLQIVASPGTRAYYPFPALYQGNNYQGKPDFSGVGNLNSFAFQMGKRYQFTFDFDGASYPRIEFSVGSIDDYDSTQIVPTPPALQLLTDGTERTDTLLSGLEHLQIPAGTVQTNQQTWTAEVTSGAGWLSVNSPMGYDSDKLSYSAQKNQSGATRIGTITLYADTAKRVFTVTQEAYDGAGELTTFSVPTNTGTYQFNVAFIPKGKFWTGGTPDREVTIYNNGSDALPSMEVTLTQDYYLGATEVTNAQYAAFLNDMGVDSTGRMPGDSIWITDSKIVSGGNSPWGVTYVNAQWQPVFGYADYPVIDVSWFGAVAYCKWLDSKISGYHFSLPTEAQWGRAALCGTPYQYNGMSDTWSSDFGWRDTNSGMHTHEVSTAKRGKNIWNLDDMSGNVWEWCNDWYENKTYPAPTNIDPTGAVLTDNPVNRVSRSASAISPGSLSSICRNSSVPTLTTNNVGFRVCAVKDNHVASPLGGTIRKVSVNTTSGALNFQLAFIPKGKFLSGTTTGTEITLTKDYYMGTTEVTNAQFAAFLNDAGIGQDGKMPNDSVGVYDSKVWQSGQYPWGLTWNTSSNKWEPCSGYDNYPVPVSWYGAAAYCDWLNTKKTSLIFKLPTEAQWQYAAQCGTQYKYEGLSDTWYDDFGWMTSNSGTKSHEVGTALKGKSPWNLKDICGNSWEWCSDWYGTTYPSPTAIDPTGAIAAPNLTMHVMLGGSFYETKDNVALPHRNSYNSIWNNDGLRVCAMAN
jgi:formylglycine-generating enzyme required for sulfatase activity